jgi:hypothetical protein
MPAKQIDPIAAAVAAELARIELPVRELARRAETHHTSLLQWFNGSRGLPLGTRSRVLAALGLKIIVRRARGLRR